MPATAAPSPLKELRLAAGLTLRELAEQIGERHSTISYWENTGRPPRAEVLIPMAKALGVTVEELLGAPLSKRSTPARSKTRQTLEALGNLPRRQQEKILNVVQALVAQAAAR